MVDKNKKNRNHVTNPVVEAPVEQKTDEKHPSQVAIDTVARIVTELKGIAALPENLVTRRDKIAESLDKFGSSIDKGFQAATKKAKKAAEKKAKKQSKIDELQKKIDELKKDLEPTAEAKTEEK